MFRIPHVFERRRERVVVVSNMCFEKVCSGAVCFSLFSGAPLSEIPAPSVVV